MDRPNSAVVRTSAASAGATPPPVCAWSSLRRRRCRRCLLHSLDGRNPRPSVSCSRAVLPFSNRVSASSRLLRPRGRHLPAPRRRSLPRLYQTPSRLLPPLPRAVTSCAVLIRGRSPPPSGFSQNNHRIGPMVDVPQLPPKAACEVESICHGVFSEFMTKVAQFEEQAKAGQQLLTRFHQELEYFRRPPIPSNLEVMKELLKSNCTGRMKSYMEAGCSLQSRNISNINQLHLCEGGLNDHINKVKALLQEIECLVKDVHNITLTASLSALEVSESPSTDSKLNNEYCFIEEEGKEDRLDNDVSLVTVMIMVKNMLNLDYTMQEKIVNALSLKTPSSELEGYCLMWDLRPYIDDNVMQLAWKMCP